MNRLPDFLIIGAQKSATSWLTQLLRRHPNVFIPEHELHFFNRYEPIAHYYKAFASAKPDQLVGEKTPDYLHLTTSQIARIRALLPQVRLIVVLRNPIERAWSQARMEISVVNKRQLTRRDLWKMALHVHLMRNRIRTAYAAALRRWLQFFPRDQLLVLFYEELRSDTAQQINRLFAFLGLPSLAVDHLEALKKQRIWPSPELELPLLLRYLLVRRYYAETLALERMGWTVPQEWPRPEHLHRLRAAYPWLPIAAGICSGLLTLVALPEYLLFSLGRYFPHLNLYRLYDQLQRWRSRRLESKKK